MQTDMGAWRAVLRCFNALPRPATVKRWSAVKIGSVGVLVILTILAVVRMKREQHFMSIPSSEVVDHRSLMTKRFEVFEAGGAEAVEKEGQNLTFNAVSPEVTQEKMADTLVSDSIPPPAPQATGERIFAAPVRTPINERVLPDMVLNEFFPLEAYFHKFLDGQQPKSPPLKNIARYDRKIPLKKALVVLENVKASSKRPMEDFFGPLRIETEFSEASALNHLVIKSLNIPIYSVIAFASYEVYLGMDTDQKTRLDEYCRNYGVGIISFTGSSKIGEQDLASNYKLHLQHRMQLVQMRLNPEVQGFWRIAKPEVVFKDPLPSTNSEWTIFFTDHPTYQPLAFSSVAPDWDGSAEGVNKAEFGVVTAIKDNGEIDGIRRVILGNDPDFFLNYIIAMEGLGWLTNGRMESPLERIVQVDVDDMFVGVSAVRTKPKDAEAMVECNRRIRQYIPNFRLFLGFTGAMLGWGDEEADKGEQMMLDYAHEFIWFNHLYRHELLYITPIDRIAGAMSKNTVFADEKGLPVIKEYMILPHHAGVYPVYPEVFDEWENLGYVKATSTLEYPYRHPQWGRRGFTHRGVKVLPRQTCRLFTKTIAWSVYGGGKQAMDESINGGYIFKIFLTTPIMVFMTHMSNYATEQLAEYEFEGVSRSISTWTNLKMIAPHPMDVADEYFHLYPDEVTPLWSDPSRDPNMKELWRVNKTLPVFPQVLIVGPQKTGTTALLSFMKIHPSLQANNPDPVLFEEVQFFSSILYDKGIDWYASRFPTKSNDHSMLFEKSATYFSHQKAARRARELLPEARIIMILNDPAKRAYSWYQHLKAHNDSITQQYSFYQIITAGTDAPEPLRNAQRRHLHDGIYAQHLSRWLLSYPSEQIYIVDGEKLIKDPIDVMNDLQKFMGVSPKIDYKTKLQYNERKGFFCVKKTGCLGEGKGRNYEKMDEASAAYLKEFYQTSNEDLKTLLDAIKRPHPSFLGE